MSSSGSRHHLKWSHPLGFQLRATWTRFVKPVKHTYVGETAPAPAPAPSHAPASAPTTAPALPPQMHTNDVETGHAPDPERAHVPAPETVSTPALPPKIQMYSPLSEKIVEAIFSFFCLIIFLLLFCFLHLKPNGG